MRFRFRGCDRQTGDPIQGHVEAANTEVAYQVLSDHGIVTETLDEHSRPSNASPDPLAIPEFADALDSALDASSSQVAFDELSERYRGKKVWVIDRDKIRQRVAQVVDSTLAASAADLESGTTARERVADAISGLFHDAHNIASQHDVERIARLRAAVGAVARTGAGAGAGAGANGVASVTNADLAEQIGRLTGVVEQAEGLIAAMSAALRSVESGAAPRRRVPNTAAPSTGPEQDQVLREIFESNLDLRRAIRDAGAAPAAGTNATSQHQSTNNT